MSFRTTKYTPVLYGTPLIDLVEGQTVIPDMSLMSSQFRRPMWVDEIRFEYIFSVTTARNLGSSIRCKLQMGRIAMTGTRDGGGFVPIWNFGTTLQAPSLVEIVHDGMYAGGNTIGHYRWKLPKPLYVPAGQAVTPGFLRQQDGFGGTAQVGISVVGRECGDANEPIPESIDVPYVAYYEPPTTGSSAISMSLDLVNPFNVPLYVQRFVGRQLQSTFNESNLALLDIAQVVIKDSWGNDVVGYPTNFGQVFDPLRRAWTFARILGPKERYVVQLSNIVENTLPEISIVGYRTEAFR